MAAQDQDGPAIPPDATPMMAQYLAIKAGNEGALLFYRMGDFYELFFEDAVKAAAVLGIALTKRGRHLGEEIPMCGVPAAGAEPYLERLIREGFKVAICEQTEDPAAARKRGGKSVVHREVVRLVTPGTITEDALLDARRGNALAALARVQGVYALASADLGSGRFVCRALPEQSVAAALARIAPGELLVPDKLTSEPALESVVRELGPRATILPPARFDSANGERALKSLYGVAALDAFGSFARAELAAAGAVADYLAVTQKGALPLLRPLTQERDGALLELDPATRRNLELTETLEGVRSGSLLDVLDMTMTAPGARLLAERLAGPLAQSPAINQRLDAVAALEAARDFRAGLRERLKTAPDLARALQRLVLKRGGPRDLSALRHGIETADALRTALDATAEPLGPELAAIAAALGAGGADLSSLAAELRRCLGPDLPLQARDGGFIAEGANPVLDEMRGLRDDSRRVIAALELRLKDETGINALKIKHNNVLGYFVEVTSTHAAKLLNGAGAQAFIHRQTLPNAARFTTTELSGLAGRIVEAAARALEVELSLFETLASQAVALGEALSTRAEALAALDVTAALAERAAQSGWVRPKVDDSFAFDIEAGRHPVVEQALKRDGVTFTANDCNLSEADGGRIWLVTGPNMAGKSTFLRQNALICILAQMGSFVPAARAHIGAADRVFSRVGAADDLARGRSTFMVEMVETAAILAQAGPRALVILDEIGRGTATFDGLSIAWGAIEHLHEVNRARALFATHYHELVALAKRLERLRPVTMRVREWKGEVVFLHEVAPGAADRSYGIQVAKLAGLPKSVITRAEAVLAALERGDEARKARTMLDDLPLFSAVSGPDPHAASAPLLARLADITPDSLSPKEALELVYELKRLAAAPP